MGGGFGIRADTLEIRLEDRESRASVTLLYGVFEEKNIIARSVRFEQRREESAFEPEPADVGDGGLPGFGI